MASAAADGKRASGRGPPPAGGVVRPGWSRVRRKHSRCRARRGQASRSRLARWREDLGTGDAHQERFRERGQPRRLLVELGIRPTGAGRQQGGQGQRRPRRQASRSSGPASHHRGSGSASGWRPGRGSASDPGSRDLRGCGPVLDSDGISVGDWASRPGVSCVSCPFFSCPPVCVCLQAHTPLHLTCPPPPYSPPSPRPGLISQS